VTANGLYEEFAALLQAEFSIPESKITPDAHLIEDLGLDSLDLVSASLAIEDRWGVRMEDEDLAEIDTISSAVSWVSARLEAKA
jgi:acyl carrier protein